MDKQRKRMKDTMIKVGLFRALKNARALIMGLLTIDFVLRVFYRYPVTGLYILLIDAVVPFLAEIILRDKVKSTQEEELPVLQKTYGYDRVLYCAEGVTALLTLITLLGWYKNTRIVRAMTWHMKMAPIFMTAVYAAAAMIWFCRYFKAFKERLNNNKL